MVSKDYYMMKVVEMGYEVEESVITSLVDNILSMPRDTTQEIYGTYEEISIVVFMDHKSKKIKKNVEKTKE